MITFMDERYKIVPKIPTDTMLLYGVDEFSRNSTLLDTTRNIWDRMYALAPGNEVKFEYYDDIMNDIYQNCSNDIYQNCSNGINFDKTTLDAVMNFIYFKYNLIKKD